MTVAPGRIMTHVPSRSRSHSSILFVALTSISIASGCSSTAGDAPVSCANEACSSAKPTGPIHGVRADGRVDVTAAEAWPTRSIEPTPLTDDEVARACTVYAACAGTASTTDSDRALLAASCAQSPLGEEERAIPANGQNERLGFALRAVLASPTCATVATMFTKRTPGLGCQEVGCWWESSIPIPTVTCVGTVATLTSAGHSFERDCARVYATCDTTSPTGCTDRHPVACDPKGTDRCDGDVKLGCDSSGRVSFHDCALVNAKCVEKEGTASCVHPTSTSACSGGAPVACEDGKSLDLCVGDAKHTVDCTTLGFTSCTAGHCKM